MNRKKIFPQAANTTYWLHQETLTDKATNKQQLYINYLILAFTPPVIHQSRGICLSASAKCYTPSN